jgi:hypothetical protein
MKGSSMTDRQPAHERTLDSFADHIITRQTYDYILGWNAQFDRGLVIYDLDHLLPGKAGGLQTREEAAAHAAAEIRASASSSAALREASHLARFLRHWDKKERFEAIGIDPDDMYTTCRETRSEVWGLCGKWDREPGVTRALEFHYQLLIAELAHAVANDGIDIEDGRIGVIEAIRDAFEAGHYEGAEPTEETWALLDSRIDLVVEGLSNPSTAEDHNRNSTKPRF